MGHWALGMGHGVWGIEKIIFIRLSRKAASLIAIAHSPLPIAQCPVPIAQCPITN
jgi:hypothetical protein